MILYHLTSIYHLATIMSAGYLKAVESNVSLLPRYEHVGPDVVWLTTSRRAGQGWSRMTPGLEFVDKTRVIFEVELPDAEVHLWKPWAEAHGSTERFIRALAAAGDESVGFRDGHDADVERAYREWYVIERAIAWPEWRSVTDRLAGTVLWEMTPGQIEQGEMTLPKLWSLPEMGSKFTNLKHLPVSIYSAEDPDLAVKID